MKINEIELGMNGVSAEGNIIEKSDPRRSTMDCTLLHIKPSNILVSCDDDGINWHIHLSHNYNCNVNFS